MKGYLEEDSLIRQLTDRIRSLSAPMQPKPTGMSTKMVPLEDIRAVLFDVYGTLFISGSGDIGVATAEDNDKLFREALVSAGLTAEMPGPHVRASSLLSGVIEQFHQQRRSNGVDFPEVDILEVWEAVFKQLPLENITISKLPLFAVEYEARVNPVWPMPGLEASLSLLKEKELVLGIVSNAQFYTPLLFRCFLDGTPQQLGFDPGCCAWSYQLLEAKPSPRLFEQVLGELKVRYGIDASQTLYVGNDCLNDLWPATLLGCKTALFTADQRSLRLREDDQRCSGIEPDLIINDLRQLDFIF